MVYVYFEMFNFTGEKCYEFFNDYLENIIYKILPVSSVPFLNLPPPPKKKPQLAKVVRYKIAVCGFCAFFV